MLQGIDKGQYLEIGNCGMGIVTDCSASADGNSSHAYMKIRRQ
jgi:hypothetical protein